MLRSCFGALLRRVRVHSVSRAASGHGMILKVILTMINSNNNKKSKQNNNYDDEKGQEPIDISEYPDSPKEAPSESGGH